MPIPLWHAVEAICREVRKSTVPYGGLNVIVTGDPFQLLCDKSECVWNAGFFQRLFEPFVFTCFIRTVDPVLRQFHRLVRSVRLSDEDIQRLVAMVRDNCHLVDSINDVPLGTVFVSPTRAGAKSAADVILERFQGELRIFNARDQVLINGVPSRDATNAESRVVDRKSQLKASLALGRGMSVRVTTNVPHSNLLNGYVGHVADFGDDNRIVVHFPNHPRGPQNVAVAQVTLTSKDIMIGGVPRSFVRTHRQATAFKVNPLRKLQRAFLFVRQDSDVGYSRTPSTFSAGYEIFRACTSPRLRTRAAQTATPFTALSMLCPVAQLLPPFSLTGRQRSTD